MTDPEKPKILILESNGTINDHTRAVLTREDWNVHYESVSKTALQRLEASKTTPFSLFISNFKLPRMEGDDIHKNAKEISPMTQRMLMVPADEPDMVIRAINKGGINSCIIYPFQDEDLINQVKHCLAQFQRSMKRQQLKRVTRHQNQQLFQIAQKMKKKSEACRKLIGEKKASVLMNRSNLRKALKQKVLNQNITLDDRLDQNNIPVTPESLENDFFILCDYIKALFDSTASKTDLDPVVLDLQSLVSTQDQTALPENDAAAAAGTPGTTTEDVPLDLIQKILQLALTSKPDPGIGASLKNAGTKNEEDDEISLTPYFEIKISKDKTAASIQRIKGMDLPARITLSSLLNYLHGQEICFGIIGDEAIEAWISNLKTGEQALVVARGEASVASEDGHIKFHFETNFTNPGKLQSDGTIDFRDRGAIPYVHKGDLLAEKTPAKEGKEGMDVFGNPILVEEALDPIFISGSGTEIKEETLTLYAALDGQPHVDAMGNITVNPELMIKGNVDFETGNIDFNGNIIVKGTIKEGFTVKGISLTAQEIEGATIELSGDLHISDGITEATITSVGNVHAKFINHSIVTGFGDLNIQREIIDSTVTLSGACQNSAGHIISSKIIAKQGIEAGKIGTSSSKPALLKIGVGEHIQKLIQKIDGQLEKSLVRLQELRKKIKLIETQDQGLYEQITQKAKIQEKAQNETREIGQAILFLKKDNDAAGLRKATLQIKKLSKTATAAEQKLNKIFETQDLYARRTEQLKEQINHIERQNKAYVLEKKGLNEFADITPSLPRLLINGTITQDTTIQGPNSSITLREDLSRSQIQETSIMEEGQYFYEMNVTDL
ncbi:MAG: hypothetical protein DRH26_02495 [Deltaproteobacteria bacterium]|nr:MAG: hypothetical protein DRH26_02495 [Deltaproteobacteria bacterium]